MLGAGVFSPTKLRGPGTEAETCQKGALHHHRVDLKPFMLCHSGKGGEIHMAGKVGFARMGKRRIEAMVADGLQRVSEPAL
nr:hypothetical protein [Marinicella sp. W31]MDC2876040.1 hypothetical protein [Marinicella sp. W31]